MGSKTNTQTISTGGFDTVLYSDHIILDAMSKGIWDRLSLKHFGDSGQSIGLREPHLIEEFLIDYVGHKLKLREIVSMRNVSNGYPVWAFKIRLVQGNPIPVDESPESDLEEAFRRG